MTKDKNEFVLSNQLLKSGTPIGGNIEGTIGGQSKRDFTAKLSIAYKESRESYYWIRLLKDSHYLAYNTVKYLHGDC